MPLEAKTPGLKVMGGDSRSEGHGFESQCRILEGRFFTLICCKILLLFVWKRPKINEKEGHFYKKKSDCNWLWTMPQIWKLGWNHLKVDVLMESFNSLPRCVRVCIKGIFYRCLSASSSSVYKKMGKQIWWFRTKIFSVHFLHDWVWLRRRCWFWFTDDVILK